MANRQDGPSTKRFRPVPLRGNVSLSRLAEAGVSRIMAALIEHAPRGECVAWGIPFRIGSVLCLREEPVTRKLPRLRAPWLVFLHTSDVRPVEPNADGFITPMRGAGQLGEHAANYVVIYADGHEERLAVRRRFQIGAFVRGWGENCFEAVADAKPRALPAHPRDLNPNAAWGAIQVRAASNDHRPWVNWLWAWENPHPRKPIVGLRFEPVCGTVVIAAISAGTATSNPLRWERRRKAILTLPRGVEFDPAVDEAGGLRHIRLDLGQLISATPRPLYPDASWARSENNALPRLSEREILVEYSAHPDACFHLGAGRSVPLSAVGGGKTRGPLRPVAPSEQTVTLRVVEKGTQRPVAVKLHVHGKAGEYLAPTDRHRIPNSDWFQDYSVDFSHLGIHHCAYVPGESTLKLPLGKVYLEVSKGFEIRPVRKSLRVTRATREIEIEIEKVLPWRESGWVSADTHVHFLSPSSALLEGAGEGVNVVNLLASQWGELVTNVGDFDGETTWGAREMGGGREYLVRVGTENRQHVLGHISLLGYGGNIIAPMTTGGPDESAIGDPIEVLLTEWARQCRKQGGVVILPHFPNPRAEGAAAIVSGEIDGVEMTSWGDLYSGIDPYSLSDWYRYLNCGYLVAAVGGTDKMSAGMAIGTVRTYAHIDPDCEFNYEAWKEAVRRAHTFVTYGPLLEFAVEGRRPGARLVLGPTGGTLDVSWKVASVTVPMSRVELIVNGEIRESRAVRPNQDAGSWSVRIERSSWLALLVRGHYRDRPEIIAAHSSPVMGEVEGKPFGAAADALTILEQIEGAIAYLDTVGTRAETARYRQMRLVLTSAHREIHNQLHQRGHYHQHAPPHDHVEHR